MLDLTAIKARHKSEYVLIPKLGSAFIQAQKDIDTLLAEVERLQKIVDRFAQHQHWCPEYHSDGICNCGLIEALEPEGD